MFCFLVTIHLVGSAAQFHFHNWATIYEKIGTLKCYAWARKLGPDDSVTQLSCLNLWRVLVRNKVREIRQFKCNKANPFAASLIKNKYKGSRSVSLDEVLKAAATAVAFNRFNQGTCR